MKDLYKLLLLIGKLSGKPEAVRVIYLVALLTGFIVLVQLLALVRALVT